MEMKLMKGITCCGDCGYYNWKKHKCTRATDEGDAHEHFYADCPLPDAAPVVRAEWIEEPDREGRYHCSNCGVVWGVSAMAMKHCPNCTAKMTNSPLWDIGGMERKQNGGRKNNGI